MIKPKRRPDSRPVVNIEHRLELKRRANKYASTARKLLLIADMLTKKLAANYKLEWDAPSLPQYKGKSLSANIYHLRVDGYIRIDSFKRNDGEVLCGKVDPKSLVGMEKRRRPPDNKQCQKCVEIAKQYSLQLP